MLSSSVGWRTTTTAGGDISSFSYRKQDGGRASKPSTDCSGRVLEMRVSPQAVELDISTGRPDSYLTLRYDGSEMEEIEVPRDDSHARMAGGGKDVTRWIGVHLFEILDHPTERRRFATIMANAELYDLVRNTKAAYPGESRLAGGVLVEHPPAPHESLPPPMLHGNTCTGWHCTAVTSAPVPAWLVRKC